MTDSRHTLRPTRVLLTRHGESESNAAHRVTGQLDSPLTEAGRRHAELLASVLRDESLDAIVTSDLSRSIEVRRELTEIHFGVLQGRFRDDRDPEALRTWQDRQLDPTNYRIPGGETILDAVQRIIRCLHEILAQRPGQTMLIVGHRHTNRILIGSLMKWPRDIWLRFKPKSTYLYNILLEETPRVETIRLDEEI